MSTIIETIGSYLNSDVLEGISGKVGADQSTVQDAIGAALPLLINALGRNAADQNGAEAITGALKNDHDGSLLENIMGLVLGNVSGKQADGAGILEHVLGGNRESVEKGVSKSSGLSVGKVANLLVMLAPVVMGALGKKRQENELDANGVQNLLNQEREATSSQLGGLERLIDADNDGDITDDLIGIGSKILGGLFGKK